MHFPSTVRIEPVERNCDVCGADDPHHLVTFTVSSSGVEPWKVTLNVSARYPESDLERIACAFLAGRLRDMAAAAEEGGYEPAEVAATWETVRPGRAKPA